MAVFQIQSPAEKLLHRISEIYQPDYPDTPSERHTALLALAEVLKSKSVSEDVFLTKARQAKAVHGKFKVKVASLVLNQYWTQTYQMPLVRGESYSPPKPRSGLFRDDLRP